jgi:hypothetical protein
MHYKAGTILISQKPEKLLQGYCKGLVEDRDDPQLRGTPVSELRGSAVSKCILFVHGTIIEFFQRPDIRDTMSHQLSGFDPVEGISQLHLAEILPMPRYLPDSYVWATLYGAILDVRFSTGKDRSAFDYLMRLESVILAKHGHLLNGNSQPDKATIYGMDLLRYRMRGRLLPPSEHPYHVLVAHPLCMSAWLGNIAYVHWSISEPNQIPYWMN